jgi:dihydropteroate synthase
MFDWGSRTYVMGILNVTPDSFSGDGLMQQPDLTTAALEQARRFVAAGADILDIGGESTRPGSKPVSAVEEMERVLPVLAALHKANLGCALSLDTYKSEVAEAAMSITPVWINDVWGLRADPRLGQVAARANCPLVLMHNRSKTDNVELRQRLGGAYLGAAYENFMEDVRRELMESVDRARAAGVKDECIILDPGIGFGKSVAHNLELIDRLGEIRSLGFPVLLGPSRKSFIGYTLDLPSEERLEGTAAAVAVGIARGADIVRVHDLPEMVRVVRMTDAIVRR